MKKVLTLCMLGIIVCSAAFSQIGKVGINTAAPAAMLHVMDSSVVFTGWSGGIPGTIGPPPVSGNGIRMMWYAQKAAFRAGRVTGTEWDKANVGNYSFAGGINTIASGLHSAAFGSTNKALGDNSFVAGASNKAGGISSFAAGVATVANGASGMVVGRFNDSLQVASTIVTPTTPLFLVGNGLGTNSRANAMSVLNNGNVGIGVSGLPAFRLHVANNTSGEGGYANGIFIQNTTSGEAGLSFRNSLIPSTKQWTIGLDQNPLLAWNYGTSFSPANTIMVLDTMGRLGVGNTSPHASALVDIQSTNKGLLLPRMTTAQRTTIATPAIGLLVYDTNLKSIFMFDGVQWQTFAMINSNMDTRLYTSTPPEIYTDAQFGFSVAISNRFAFVGAPYNDNYPVGTPLNVGSVSIYEKKRGWELVQTLEGSATSDNLGWDVDVAGYYAVIGVPGDDSPGGSNTGIAQILEYNGTNFNTQIMTLGSGNNARCGYSVAISERGVAVIGIPGDTSTEGSVRIMEKVNAVWVSENIENGVTDNFGSHVDISGNKILVGAFDLGNNDGRFYVLTDNGTNWIQEFESTQLVAKSLDLEGDLIAVGRTDDVLVFKFNGTTWVQISDINDPNIALNRFGAAVKISGDYLFIGAPETIVAGEETGVVYCYKRNGSSYVMQSTILSVLGEDIGKFGTAVDAYYNDILIGAPEENSAKGTAGFGNIYSE